MSYIVTWKVVKHMSVQKKHDPSINPVAAAVTGAVVGAGVAVAGVVAMKDENNRKAVQNVMDTVKDKASNYMEDANKKAESAHKEMQDKMHEGQKKNKQMADPAK